LKFAAALIRNDMNIEPERAAIERYLAQIDAALTQELEEV
jgi:hypothetical protein